MGIREGRGVVLAHNRPAVAFLRMRAMRVAPYANAAQPSVEVWYDLDHALRLLRRGRARKLQHCPVIDSLRAGGAIRLHALEISGDFP